MELINCGRCGKLQVQRPDTLCKDCLQLYISESLLVKEFIKMNPGATMMDLVQYTGFSIKKIKEMIE